jgi:predicted acetyltransferase
MKTARLVDLKEAPQYKAAYLRLIDETFPKGSPTKNHSSAEAEFPLLLDQENHSRCLLLVDEDQPKEKFSTWPVIAGASYRIFDFQLKGLSLPFRCAGIGLVNTHPSFQRKGYGHTIQSAVEARAQKEGALCTVLWSDLVTYYQGLGYLVAGSEFHWQFSKSDFVKIREKLESTFVDPPGKTETLNDFSKVYPCYLKFHLGPKRNPALYTKLLKLPNTYAVAFTATGDKEPCTYAVMGKARDLRDTLHELVGDAKGVRPLLRRLLQDCESGLRVYHPTDSALNRELKSVLGEGSKSGMAFFKVINGPQLVKWFQGSGALSQDITISDSENGFQLTKGEVTFFESRDYGHLVQLFFGPWKINELEEIPDELQNHLSGKDKSLGIYFWGLDSV